jgi:hypothetical protein
MSKSSSENKYKRWVITAFIPEGRVFALQQELDYYLSTYFEEITESYAGQLEVTPTTGKVHLQACVELKTRVRHSTLLKKMSSLMNIKPEFITIDRMHGTMTESVLYCTKEESRLEESIPVIGGNFITPYSGEDIAFFKLKENRYPWQNTLFDLLYVSDSLKVKDADDRTIIWISDSIGCSGKSVFVKFACFFGKNTTKVSFGTANQLRSGVIDAGPNLIYFIDIPRTLGTDDSINNIITVIEDLKNGFVVSNFHGKSRQLVINPPHIVVFANFDAPIDKLSSDRWDLRFIDKDKELIKWL